MCNLATIVLDNTLCGDCVTACICVSVINCGTLSNPANGVVQFLSSSTAGGEVVYVCDSGYEVVGDSGRECLCSGVWSGSEPICQGVHHYTYTLHVVCSIERLWTSMMQKKEK